MRRPPPWIALVPLAAAAALLGAPAWRVLARAPSASAPALRSQATSVATGEEPPSISLPRLSCAYFLEGLGYIVSGTFAVAAAQRLPSVAPYASWVWVLAGLAAAPSAALWARVARAVGERKALVASMGVPA